MQHDPETIAQWRSEKPNTGGGAHQRESRQIDPDRAGGWTLSDDDVELEVLHRRIEDLLEVRREAVDLVDEHHVARLEVGQQSREIAGFLDERSRCRLERRALLAGDDVRQRRLAEPR